MKAFTMMIKQISLRQGRRVFFVLQIGLMLLISAALPAQTPTDYQEWKDPEPANGAVPESLRCPPLDRVWTNAAFGKGERLEFDVDYGIINAGTAVMEVPNTVVWNGQRCWQFVSTARTNATFDVLYRVEDRVVTYSRIDGFFPIFHEKRLREGRYKSDRWIAFDHARCRAWTGKGDTVRIPQYTQDVLGAFYWVRTLNLEVGDTIDMDNFDGKNYPLRVFVQGREKIKVPAGEFMCLRLEPVLASTGLFFRKGKMTLWLTDDNAKMPVLMRTEIFFGAVEAKLTHYKLGKVEE